MHQPAQHFFTKKKQDIWYDRVEYYTNPLDVKLGIDRSWIILRDVYYCYEWEEYPVQVKVDEQLWINDEFVGKCSPDLDSPAIPCATCYYQKMDVVLPGHWTMEQVDEFLLEDYEKTRSIIAEDENKQEVIYNLKQQGYKVVTPVGATE